MKKPNECRLCELPARVPRGRSKLLCYKHALLHGEHLGTHTMVAYVQGIIDTGGDPKLCATCRNQGGISYAGDNYRTWACEDCGRNGDFYWTSLMLEKDVVEE